MQTSRLPEKPWRAEALVRLVAGIAVCLFGGMGTAATVVRYFGEPRHTATLWFLCFAAGTFACFAGAVCVLVRPWPFDNFLKKLLTLLLCIYGGFFLLWLAYRLVDPKSEIKNPTINVLIGILAFQGMALVLVHFFLREHQTGWAEGFGFRTNPGLAVFMGIVVGLVALPLTLYLNKLCIYILQHLSLNPQPQETVVVLQNTEGWQNRVVMGIATIVIAPVAEEILFRGILYPFIKRVGYPRLAWWITALVFAGVHFDLPTFVPLAFLALVLIWLYEHTGNLLACIVTHSLFNAANFVALYLMETKLHS
ncbi:MAG TPA: type II CAAX endopeptidase family protein [Verrucomicrobiae bacterium]|nr:type II CAAX endopeptidase family protein [Verrucomicrobiae bacterium]